MAYYSPEQFVTNLGYKELLFYSSDFSNTPNFDTSTVRDLIRARDYNNLFPKWTANTEEDVIASLPDKNIFTVDKASIDGTFKIDLAATIENALEHPTARLFEHMRNSWAGIKSNGVLISPRSDILGGHPGFSLASAYHGTLHQCFVNKLDINVSAGDKPVEFTLGVVATGHDPTTVFTNQAMQSIMQSSGTWMHSRRIIYGRDCRFQSAQDSVVGNFGLPDAKSSALALGASKPSPVTNLITNFTVSFDNRMEPQYGMKSHEISDMRKRFEENSFPRGYACAGPRKVSGQIEWAGNIDPVTFIEKLVGPASIQNRTSMILNCQCFTLEITDPVWDLSEKPVNLERTVRSARFNAVSNGPLLIDYYRADYGRTNNFSYKAQGELGLKLTVI